MYVSATSNVTQHVGAQEMLHAGANVPKDMQAVVVDALAEPGSPPEAAWTTMFMCSHDMLTG